MTRPAARSGGVLPVLAAWVGFLLLMVAHFGVRPFVDGPAAVDFPVIAVLFASVRMRPGLAALSGFLVGVALDALVPSHFGAQALAFTLVAYGASWLKGAFFTDNPGLTGLFIGVGKWLVDILLAVVVGTGQAPWWKAVLLWAPLSALLTALVALTLLTLLRPLFRPAAP